jgi:hypothetical protein
MIRFSLLTKSLVLLLFLGSFALAQDQSVEDKIKDQVGEIGEKVGELGEKVGEIGKSLDTVPAVKEVSAGILQPIYNAADKLTETGDRFPAFYWIAFALMAAGVVSFAFQLVFTKFLLLIRLHLNIKEIMSDILGLFVSVVGLILTTQAATQNSKFSESPVLVISATAVGVVVGFIFYLWGQKQEFQAAKKPGKALPQ